MRQFSKSVFTVSVFLRMYKFDYHRSLFLKRSYRHRYSSAITISILVIGIGQNFYISASLKSIPCFSPTGCIFTYLLLTLIDLRYLVSLDSKSSKYDKILGGYPVESSTCSRIQYSNFWEIHLISIRLTMCGLMKMCFYVFKYICQKVEHGLHQTVWILKCGGKMTNCRAWEVL